MTVELLILLILIVFLFGSAGWAWRSPRATIPGLLLVLIVVLLALVLIRHVS